MTARDSTAGTVSPAMKLTSLRFSDDLWALLQGEAARSGVSVSQYIREAALARAAFAVGARAGAPDALLAAWAGSVFDGRSDAPEHAAATQQLIAALARSQSRTQREEAAALRGESRQARHQAKTLRDQKAGIPRSE